LGILVVVAAVVDKVLRELQQHRHKVTAAAVRDTGLQEVELIPLIKIQAAAAALVLSGVMAMAQTPVWEV